MPEVYHRPQKLTFKRYPLDISEVELLRKAVKSELEEWVVVGLLESGLRVSEWLGIKPENVYLDRGILVFRGKGSKLRQIPLTDNLRKLVTSKMNNPSKFPEHRNRAEEVLKRVVKRAGIKRPVTPHILRHTYAVLELTKGVDIRTLQLRMGHSSLDTTALYLKYLPGEKEGKDV